MSGRLCAFDTVMTSDMLDVLETTTVLAKYPENGRINKPATAKPPPKPRFPIPVDGLEEYIKSRQTNDCEEFRREYMVRSIMACSSLLIYCNGYSLASIRL